MRRSPAGLAQRALQTTADAAWDVRVSCARLRQAARPRPTSFMRACAPHSGPRFPATAYCTLGRWPMMWPMADVVAKGGIRRLRVPR
eukprot:813010-Prymnesium_polylepis.1